MKKYTEQNWGTSGYYDDTEHLVLDVSDEPILINFVRLIDDLMISTPDGDVLIAWKLDHNSEFDERQCLLISAKDNLKEIAGLKTTLLAVRAKEQGKTLKVYITAQRN